METTSTESLPTNLVDNYKTACEYIMTAFLEKAPEGIREYDRKVITDRLKMLQEGTSDGMGYFNFDLTREGRVSCGIGVELESADTIEDAEGNRWRSYFLVARTNWPSYGSDTPAKNLERIQLMLEVTLFAQFLQDTVPMPIYKMVKSKEQVAQEKEQKEKRAIQERVERAVNFVRKGMRVGARREIPTELLKDVPHGTYEVEINDFDDKTFTVRYGTFGASVTRKG